MNNAVVLSDITFIAVLINGLQGLTADRSLLLTRVVLSETLTILNTAFKISALEMVGGTFPQGVTITSVVCTGCQFTLATSTLGSGLNMITGSFTNATFTIADTTIVAAVPNVWHPVRQHAYPVPERQDHRRRTCSEHSPPL